MSRIVYPSLQTSNRVVNMLWKTFTRSAGSRVCLFPTPLSKKNISNTGFIIFRDAEILLFLLKENLIDGNNMTVTGKTLGENLKEWAYKYGELDFKSQDVIKPLDKPIKSTGHIRCEHAKRTLVDISSRLRSEFLKEISLRGGLSPKSRAKKG